MSRIARIAFENGFFHVFNRGLAKQEIFIEDSDYRKFLSKLQELTTKNRFDHSIYVYILIPTHFHLLIQTRKIPIATIISSLLTSYSMYFNLKYKRFGPLFQGRFKSKLCDPTTYFLGASRYIHLNPIEVGLASDFSDYPWSSYQELFGSSSFSIVDKSGIKRLIGNKPTERKKYQQFLLDGIPIVNQLAKQYTFQKQIEGDAKFNVLMQKRYLKKRIRHKIESLFNIKT